MEATAKHYFQKKLESKPDAADRFANTSFNEASVKKIHFTGVCGKAMASLAGLFVEAGYLVTGSDDAWNPPMSTMLEAIGIPFQPFAADNVLATDLVIVGNALSSSNIEAVTARRENIPQLSSAEAYARFFIKDKTSIVIAGTHGKTTTSALAAHLFTRWRSGAAALVGGIMRGVEKSYHYSSGAGYSVVEGDEYDTAYFDKAPKFLYYRPTVGVITSIEFDHADIYDDIEDYCNAFLFFAGEIPINGYLLISEQVPEVLRTQLAEVCKGDVYVYGGTVHDIIIENIRIDRKKGGQLFDLTVWGKTICDIFIPLFGTYNVENAASVAAIAIREGVDETFLKESFTSFQGVEQRQEIISEHGGIIVIDDFAHHPTAVRATLGGLRAQYPDRRLIAVFEPRSTTSRRKDFERPYSESFDDADEVVIATPPVKSVDILSQMMDVAVVVHAITDRGIPARTYKTTSEIEAYLKETIQKGDVVVIMSNGHFDGLKETIGVWVATGR